MEVRPSKPVSSTRLADLATRCVGCTMKSTGAKIRRRSKRGRRNG